MLQARIVAQRDVSIYDWSSSLAVLAAASLCVTCGRYLARINLQTVHAGLEMKSSYHD